MAVTTKPEGYAGVAEDWIKMSADTGYKVDVVAPDDPTTKGEYELTIDYPAPYQSTLKFSVVDCSPIVPAVPFLTLSIGETKSSEKIFN